MRLLLFRALAALALAWPLAAAAQALVTILDGDAKVIHPRGSYAALEGLKLPPAALVNTGAQAALLRIEWPDGSAADLGPATMVMLLPERMGEKAPKSPGLYLLRGSVKVTAKAATSSPVVVSPALEVPPFAGVAVLRSGADGSGLFAESGSLQLIDRSNKAPLQLAAGQFWSRGASGAGGTQPRPPSDWLAKLPRAYRDTLPLRREAMLARNATPKPQPLPAYAELRDWLFTETLVRRALVTQFTAWAQEPALKSALITHINDHREWGPIVLPPPPPKPDPARAPAAASGARWTP